MSEDGWLKKITDQLNDPLDWALAIAGGVIGFGGTVLSHGTDAGGMAAAGAGAAVSARKAVEASLERSRLRRAAQGMAQAIQSYSGIGPGRGPHRDLGDLQALLSVEISLWEKDKTKGSNAKFAKRLEEVAQKLRDIATAPLLALPPPNH
jgi:hypothetical protein